MRWPWVSREAYEALETYAKDMYEESRAHAGTVELERDRWQRLFEKQLDHNRALVQQIVELRKDGFAPPMAYPSPDAPASLPAKVEAALKKAEAGLPRDVKVAMREKASALLAAEKSPDDVVEIITRGLQVSA